MLLGCLLAFAPHHNPSLPHAAMSLGGGGWVRQAPIGQAFSHPLPRGLLKNESMTQFWLMSQEKWELPQEGFLLVRPPIFLPTVCVGVSLDFSAFLLPARTWSHCWRWPSKELERTWVLGDMTKPLNSLTSDCIPFDFPHSSLGQEYFAMESFVKDGKGLGRGEKIVPFLLKNYGPSLHALLCWPSCEVCCIEGKLHSFSVSLLSLVSLTPASLKSAAKICISLRCKFPNYIWINPLFPFLMSNPRSGEERERVRERGGGEKKPFLEETDGSKLKLK